MTGRHGHRAHDERSDPPKILRAAARREALALLDAKSFVIVGLYRFSRNPMYLAVTLVLLGWAASFGSTSLLLYAAGFFIVVHLRVVFGEEPWLARTHGDARKEYASRVPRWLGRVRKCDGVTPAPRDT